MNRIINYKELYKILKDNYNTYIVDGIKCRAVCLDINSGFYFRKDWFNNVYLKQFNRCYTETQIEDIINQIICTIKRVEHKTIFVAKIIWKNETEKETEIIAWNDHKNEIDKPITPLSSDETIETCLCNLKAFNKANCYLDKNIKAALIGIDMFKFDFSKQRKKYSKFLEKLLFFRGQDKKQNRKDYMLISTMQRCNSTPAFVVYSNGKITIEILNIDTGELISYHDTPTALNIDKQKLLHKFKEKMTKEILQAEANVVNL